MGKKLFRDKETITSDDVGGLPEETLNPEPKWEINADIDPEKRKQAMEYLDKGTSTRKVSQFLGILVHQIVRK